MDKELERLIAECIQLEEELGLLTPVMLYLNPSWNVEEMGKETLVAEARKRFNQKWNLLGGWDKVKREYDLQEKELSKRLSDLAERLEEEGFEIEKFRPRIPGSQFGWLLSEKGRIKKHLRGIDVGNGGQ
jgi:hypothetical protein